MAQNGGSTHHEGRVEVPNGGPDDQADSAEVAAPWDATANIHRRMMLAAASVKTIEKRGTVRINNKDAYNFVTHDDAMDTAKAALSAQGVGIEPDIVSMEQEQNRTKMEIKVDFVNVDNPEDLISRKAFGYGVDQSDKGPGKAYSYALKLALLKALQIPAGDAEDVERYDQRHENPDTELDERFKAIATSWAQLFRGAIQAQETVDDLKHLQADHKAALMATTEDMRGYLVELIQEQKRLKKADNRFYREPPNETE